MEIYPYSELATLVLAKRGNAGIRKAAKEIGISPTTLSKIENGHLPDEKTIQKLCQWLNIKRAWVICDG